MTHQEKKQELGRPMLKLSKDYVIRGSVNKLSSTWMHMVIDDGHTYTLYE